MSLPEQDHLFVGSGSAYRGSGIDLSGTADHVRLSADAGGSEGAGAPVGAVEMRDCALRAIRTKSWNAPIWLASRTAIFAAQVGAEGWNALRAEVSTFEKSEASET